MTFSTAEFRKGEQMATQQYRAYSVGTQSRRDLNQVQQVMRMLIWIGVFIVTGIVLGLLAALVGVIGSAVLGEVGVACAGPVGLVALVLLFVVPTTISRCLYIIPEYQRVVVLKMGEFVGVRGPGQFWVIPYPPFYQSAAMMLDMRIQTQTIKAAETLTKDNVPVGCEAVLFWRVENPRIAALKVKNHAEAVYMAANSALKDTIGTLELSDLLGQRELVAQKLKDIIDHAAENFGVDVSSVEITDVHVPSDLIQELSVRAQSERAAQAKIIEAKAELEVSRQFQDAANSMDLKAMELYRLNVLERIGREEGSQIVIYGLGSGDLGTSQQIASSAAGARAGMAKPTQHKPAGEGEMTSSQ
jgi:regulator of protease activity HflC (stomatin/prohibitin superfamily)